MPEEKRTFEISTQAVHGRLQLLKSPSRPSKANQPDREGFSAAQLDNGTGGFANSRDIILRLIDWLKEEQR